MVRKCGCCDLGFKKSEAFICCDACKIPHHQHCSKLSDNEFDLASDKKSSLKWYCILCDNHVSDILTNFDKFKKINAEIKSVKDEINDKLLDLEVRMRKCEDIEKNPVISSTIERVLNQKMPDTPDEEKALIEKKKGNLIYFNIPESSNDEIEDRIKYDYQCLREIYGSNIVKTDHISNLFRVGKKTERSRPLIVKFNDQTIKENYVKLSFGKKLTLKQNREIINVSATHDKTKKQRDDYKKLSTELKERKENGEENVGIRNNRIVTNFQNQTRGTKQTWATIASSMR